LPERSKPPFRADHVGSLLRPATLQAARDEFQKGGIDAKQLKAIEDRAIRDAVGLQRETGLASITDGELRRASWHMDFIYEIGGITRVDEQGMHIQFQNEHGGAEFNPPASRVDGPIHLNKTIFGDAFTFLRDAVSGDEVPKLTIPSPSMVHFRGGRDAIDAAVYPDLDAFWADLSAAYAQEIDGLHGLGCRYLQLDDTSLAYVNDPKQREHIREGGGDPEHQHDIYIASVNQALANRPDDMVVTTHLCRGNHASSWVASGGYDFVAEPLFNDLNVDGFFLEYDDERSGTFEPLRFVPKDKTVVLGLVTSKRAELESKDEIKRRIDEAAKYIDLDQLCLSPQCGFSSTTAGNDLTLDEQKAKLALVVEVAAEVWR